MVRIGKHSELLKTTDDPLAYAIDEVKRYNEELKNNKIDLAEAIAFIAVRSYKTGYNDAVEELKQNVRELL